MARNFSSQLAGQIGEALVVAELGRKGITATAFSGNVPDIDILAYQGHFALPLQVKAWRRGAVSFDANRMLELAKTDDGRQSVVGIKEELDPNLIFVFVRLSEDGDRDRFFILTQRNVQLLLETPYREFLARHNGLRPRNPNSTHTAITLDQLKPYENRWNIIKQRFQHEAKS